MLIVFYIRYISLIIIGKKVYNSYEVYILLFSPIYLITEDGRLPVHMLGNQSVPFINIGKVNESVK